MFGVNWQTSKRQYGITEEREVRIRMSDGVDIDTDVFRPDAEGKFPALIAMAGRGIGPTVVKRIMAGSHGRPEKEFYLLILENEKQFIRTREWWAEPKT